MIYITGDTHSDYKHRFSKVSLRGNNTVIFIMVMLQ